MVEVVVDVVALAADVETDGLAGEFDDAEPPDAGDDAITGCTVVFDEFPPT